VFTSIRPEGVAEVDSETRDRWTVQAAAHTLDRIGEFVRSFELEGDLEEALIETGIDGERASGIALAREHYGTTPAYLDALRESALDAARQVAGETDAVEAPGIDPGEDDGREPSLSRLQTSTETTPIDADTVDEPAAERKPTEPDATSTQSEPSGAEIEAEAEATAPEPEAVEPDAASTSETGAEPEAGEPGEATSAVGRDVDGEASAGSEPTSEPTAEETTDDLGDFEPSGSAAGEPAGSETETRRETEPGSGVPETSEAETEVAKGEADEEAFYELDEDERAEVEEEFGVDFSTGDEVGEPGEAGIDLPDADELADIEAETGARSGIGPDESGAEPADSPTETPDEPAATEPAADESADGSEAAEPEPEPEAEESEVNVEDAAMETMRDLAGGDGADRAEVVSRVVEEHGVEPGDVEDAIESALMSGRCYEPQDGVLKPI
jgi:chemotaxis protein histidine kinase CheA